MKSFTFLFFLSTLLAVLVTLAATSNVEVIQQVVEMHRLRPQSGTAAYPVRQINCLSWRLGVETNNIRDWSVVPSVCKDYISNYMLGGQYGHDCDAMADAAINYAKGLKLGGDGKDIWIFDVDETTLSNLPYFSRTDVAFGTIPMNGTSLFEWFMEGKAPPIRASLRLYNTLVSLGIKIVFITGAPEFIRQARDANLKKVGYAFWLKLILRGESDGVGTVEYKSSKRTELVKAGYRIVGNTGDQWSDLIGENAGTRTFKVPNPMYYVA